MTTSAVTNDATAPAVEETGGGEEFDLRSFTEKVPIKNVPISSLILGFYLRQGGTNAVHVQLLAGVAGAAELPPILVQERTGRVIDGMHRLEAAKLRGDSSIRAHLLDCTDDEALVLAIKSNTLHGLPLSKADRICGAKRVLTAHPDWSDRTIAGIAGLSAKTIASLRNRSTVGAQFNGKRLGRDGRRRPVTAGEGRKRAAEYILAHPDAPLRQVAREADVSLGTVHDVSSRIRRGAQERHRAGSPTEQFGEGRSAAIADRPAAPGKPASLPLPRQSEITPTWSAISAKVANDPTIRYTEGGKEFLRWMTLRAARIDEWRELVDAVPVHWVGGIASVADNISYEWSQFAARLRNRHEATG
jgi:ParB-like chromosome segregation protein Spo0J